MAICENTEKNRPITCRFTVQDLDGEVCHYDDATLDTIMNQFGDFQQVHVRVPSWSARRVRQPNRDAVIEDLTARVEAALAELERIPGREIAQAIKILRGKL